MESSQFSTLRKLPLLAAMLVWTLAVIAMMPRQANATSGAIFTTNVDASKVNQNQYDAKTDVYLSGGPHSCGGAGLVPDGTYYFQVTDPSGAVLLSSDPLQCRVVTVSGGVITAYSPDPSCTTVRNIGTPIVSCGDGKVTVQLAPFDDTPNAGGVYKAWLEPTTVTLPADCHPAADEVSDHDGWAACGNFDNSSSKTDNFRVRVNQTPPPSLTAEVDLFKFCDVNGNGVLDPTELLFGLSGWTVNVTQGLNPPACTGTTDATGLKVCPGLTPGDYAVSEVTQTGYKHTATCIDGFCGVCSQSPAVSCNFDVDCPGFGGGETCTLFDGVSSEPITLADGQIMEVDFGNVGGITGRKFSDLNGNGVDNSEPGVQGVQFLLTGTALDGITPISLCTNTDANGNYSFPLTPGDNLKVTEVHPPGTIATTPLTCTGSFGDPATPSTCAGFNCSFGNACLSGNCAAKTMGWWKNSGNPSVTAADLAFLNGLNLRDAKGNHVTLATRAALKTWLGNATATNMAYMLSAQLATMELNVRHGNNTCNLSGVSIYVGTPPTTTPPCLGKGTGTPLVNANGFIALSALMTDANAELGSYPVTTSGKTDAVCQGFKETALDKANNSEVVGGPGIIDVACPAVNNPCPTPPSP